MEEGLPEVTAWLRQHSGTNFCSKLRKRGHTPCVLFSLPGNTALSLSLDAKDAARLVREYGRNGLQAQVLRLNIQQEPPCSSSSSEQQQQQQPLASVRVLPKEVHMNAVSLDVENFRLMFCPPDRLVTVETPVKIWNADIAPGVKAGGWLHVVNRTVPLLCEGWAVRPYLELDVRNMRVKDVVRFRDVPLPQGCKLKVKDPLQPVVRCAARVGGD
ncbi:hypothetical protein OEZ86_007240 [Tetradesmus obliquus]|nr:hypothetical protein OEZ86_007240 [Tetradesmus obliquus]